MNFKVLIILALAQYVNSYNPINQKWSFFKEGKLTEDGQHFSLNEVNCTAHPNIINYVESGIIFKKDLVFDWVNEFLGTKFLSNTDLLRAECPMVEFIVDPRLNWNKAFVGQLENFQVPQVVTSLVEFSLRYKLSGLVISFNELIVINDAKTMDFFSQLSKAFKSNNLSLLGYFDLDYRFTSDLRYIRPVVFE